MLSGEYFLLFVWLRLEEPLCPTVLGLCVTHLYFSVPLVSTTIVVLSMSAVAKISFSVAQVPSSMCDFSKYLLSTSSIWKKKQLPSGFTSTFFSGVLKIDRIWFFAGISSLNFNSSYKHFAVCHCIYMYICIYICLGEKSGALVTFCTYPNKFLKIQPKIFSQN